MSHFLPLGVTLDSDTQARADRWQDEREEPEPDDSDACPYCKRYGRYPWDHAEGCPAFEAMPDAF